MYDSETPAKDNSLYNLLAWLESQSVHALKKKKILILTQTRRVSERLHIFVGEFYVVVFYLFKIDFDGFVICHRCRTRRRARHAPPACYLKAERRREA